MSKLRVQTLPYNVSPNPFLLPQYLYLYLLLSSFHLPILFKPIQGLRSLKPISPVASSPNKLREKNSKHTVKARNGLNSFISPENVLHPTTRVPLSFLLLKQKLSKSAKQTLLRFFPKLKSKAPKIPIKKLERSHRSNGFIVRNMGILVKPRELPVSLPPARSVVSNDENLESSSVSDRNSSFSTTETEDSDASCERWKIDGKDWSDFGSSKSVSLSSDYGLPEANQSIAANDASDGSDKEEAGHDIENHKSLQNGKVGQWIGISKKKTILSFLRCGSTASYARASIGSCRSSCRDGESGVRQRCMPSAPKKLQTRKLKCLVRSSMKQLKEIMKVQDTKGGEKELWRKRILKGRRCRPLEFSGVIQYDERGNKTAKNVIPGYGRESSTVDLDGDRDYQLREISIEDVIPGYNRESSTVDADADRGNQLVGITD